jgi:hypothetical protein
MVWSQGCLRLGVVFNTTLSTCLLIWCLRGAITLYASSRPSPWPGDTRVEGNTRQQRRPWGLQPLDPKLPPQVLCWAFMVNVPPPPPDRGSTNLSRLAREALRVALICRTCPCHNGAPAFVDKNYRTQLLCRVWHSTKKPGWTVHSTKSLLSAPEIGGTLCWITWISFLHSFFIFRVTCSSNLNYLRKFNRTNKI